jgi:urea transport system substrate-binding protein
VGALADDLLGGLGCTVAGRATVAGDDDIAAAVAAIVGARPDAVISTLGWNDTAEFARALRSVGMRPEATPLLALPCGTSQVPARETLAGVYTAQVAGTGGPATPAPERPATEAGAGATSGIRLWAQAVRDADTTDVRQVRDAMRHQSIATPDGIIAVDPGTQHTWHRTTVARIRPDGRLDAVTGGTGAALRPVPYPLTRSRAQWDQLTAALFRRWGGGWEPPQPPTGTLLPPSAPSAAGAPR